jgi:hypothetical protein
MVAINHDYAPSRTVAESHRHRNSCTRKPPYPRSISATIGHRFYSPSLHTWISRDPAAEKGFLATHIPLSARQHSFSIGNHDAITEFIRMNSALYAVLLNDPVSDADYLGLISYLLINCKIDYKYGCNKCMWDCSCPVGWSPTVASRPAPCNEQQTQTCYKLDTSDYVLGGAALLLGGWLALPAAGAASGVGVLAPVLAGA